MGARHSDPSHALLEILDPSQNGAFSDNYLDFPVDLSKVLFVCTANDESKINPILRDRLHIVRLDGYDEHEKLQIAKRYLIPNALAKCGLKTENIQIGDDVLTDLIKWYCRESGVRSLGQHIERICYKSALQFAEAGITYDDINRDQTTSTNPDSGDDSDSVLNSETANITESDSKSTMDCDQSGYRRGKRILDTLSHFVRTLSHHKVDRTMDSFTEGGSNDNAVTSSIKINEGSKSLNDENGTFIDQETLEHSTNLPQEVPFVSITRETLSDYVGLRKYHNDRTFAELKSTPCGVVTGLAYTSNGGCITYVETIKYRKNGMMTNKEGHNNNNHHNHNSGGGNGGNIKATGQLGKVMAESVEIAQCVARAVLSNRIDCHNTFFEDYNVHLHCPEGGISKDGPSAGITMVTALLSLALDHKVGPNVAMTGEVTLTGKILKIGGLKEKLLAAKRANIDTVLLPKDNYDDFYDDQFGVPQYLREHFVDVHFVSDYDEVLHILFNQHLPSIKVRDDAMTNEFEENKFITEIGSDLIPHQSPQILMPKPL